MDTAITTLAGAVIVAVISALVTHSLTRKRQLEAEWRKDKLEYYSQLLDSMRKIASDPIDPKLALEQYAHFYNMVGLVAPQKVANIIFKLYEGQKQRVKQEKCDLTEATNSKKEWLRGQKDLRRDMVLAMREDLRIRPKDDAGNFHFELQSPLQLDD